MSEGKTSVRYTRLFNRMKTIPGAKAIANNSMFQSFVMRKGTKKNRIEGPFRTIPKQKRISLITPSALIPKSIHSRRFSEADLDSEVSEGESRAYRIYESRIMMKTPFNQGF